MEEEDKYRIIETEDGKKITAIRHPRYGSWSLKFEHGDLPEILKGEWTEYDKMLITLNSYLQNRDYRRKTKIKDVS